MKKIKELLQSLIRHDKTVKNASESFYYSAVQFDTELIRDTIKDPEAIYLAGKVDAYSKLTAEHLDTLSNTLQELLSRIKVVLKKS